MTAPDTPLALRALAYAILALCVLALSPFLVAMALSRSENRR